MDFLQRTPFFRMLVPLVVGIVVFQYWELNVLAEGILLISAALLLSASFVLTNTRRAYLYRWLFGAGIALWLFAIGYVVSDHRTQQSVFNSPVTSGIFQAEVMDTPTEKSNSMQCRVQVVGYYDSVMMVKMSAPSLVYVAKDSDALDLKKGDVVLMRTTFQSPAGRMNPAGFDYAAYLKRKGITMTAYVPAGNWQKVDHRAAFSIASLAEQCRNRLLSVYEGIGLNTREFAVLAALTLGYKDAIDIELREDFTHAGAMHILAVSGLHVGVIYLILHVVLSFLFKSSQRIVLPTLLMVGLLWCYAFMTGLPPSVIRATTMFSFVAMGKAFNRKSQLYNTIAISAFIILLQNPDYLFDVGFQLSYSAVISIVYFQPIISKWMYFNSRVLRWGWDLTAVSLAAQLGTLPLALYYFHQFPNYFLLTNFIVIPLATIIIYVAVVLLMLSWIPWLALIPSILLKYLLLLMNNAVGVVHDLPHAISIFYIDTWQLSLLFTGLLLFAFFIDGYKFWSVSGALVVVLLLLVTEVYRDYNAYQTDSVIVYADRKNTHINFVNGKQHQLITSDSVAAKRTAGNFWKNRDLDPPVITTAGASFFKYFAGERYLVLQDEWLHKQRSYQPIIVDKLIIGNAIKPRAEEILECITPAICIADPSISPWYIDQLRKSCEKRNIVFYSIADQGAYVCNFKH